jgi:hypothetical protein
VPEGKERKKYFHLHLKSQFEVGDINGSAFYGLLLFFSLFPDKLPFSPHMGANLIGTLCLKESKGKKRKCEKARNK